MAASSPSTVRLSAGVVAYNDADRLASAVHSLLGQRLPPRLEWNDLWLIVSPSEDRTVEVARRIAQEDPRIRLVEEPSRRGKSAALGEAMARAEGDYLVMLNGDARALPGSVPALVRAVPVNGGPFAIMAHPVPATEGTSPLDQAVQLMWALHHRFHDRVLGQGSGTHLSDEMMLLPVAELPPLPPGIITDGAYIGSWLASNGGTLGYARDALVSVTVPASLREHLLQRRRIHRGHRQVARLTGGAPTTLQRWGLSHPREAAELFLSEARHRGHEIASVLALLSIEGLASLLALTDEVFGRREPVAWERIRGRPWEGVASGSLEEPLS